MTHKFEFGDKVQRMSHFKSIGVVIVPVTSLGMTSVLFDGDNNCSDFHAGDLEPIPHPDTARLDWLENETKIVGDSVNLGYDGVYFYTNEDGSEQENFVDLREAIDFLIKLWAAPCNYKPLNGGNTCDRSAASNVGNYSAAEVSGLHSVACALGAESKAKAAAGGAIVCVYRNGSGDLIHIRAAKVGENGIKADTWYMLNAAGEFVECD